MGSHGYAYSQHCTLYGDDNLEPILILGPVTPAWSGGEFCMGLIAALTEQGYCVYVLDSVHYLGDLPLQRSSEEIIDSLAGVISEQFPNIQCIMGYALGGTLACKLAHRLEHVTHVVSLSGPGFIDAPLCQALSDLNVPLRQGDLASALFALAKSVAPKGSIPSQGHIDAIPDDDQHLACTRMLNGFEFLLQLDAREDLAKFKGNALCVVGELSQLATRDNQALQSGNSLHTLVVVPNAGMRVLCDNIEYTISEISSWLKDEN